MQKITSKGQVLELTPQNVETGAAILLFRAAILHFAELDQSSSSQLGLQRPPGQACHDTGISVVDTDTSEFPRFSLLIRYHDKKKKKTTESDAGA